MVLRGLCIDDLDEEGRGLARHEALTVHVAGALPGDRVAATIEHRSPHRPEAWAKLVVVESPSPQRVSPVCPATGRCGGCALGGLDYEAQLAHKARRVGRALGMPPPSIVRSPRPSGYRGIAKLVYGRAPGGSLALGAYAPRSHTLVDLSGCRVVEPGLEAVRAAILEVLRREVVAPYDERTSTGLLGYVVLRSNLRNQVLVTLVGADLEALAVLATKIVHPAVIGVAGNLRPRGNAIFGPETRSLVGAAEIEETVGPVQVLLSPTAFFQVNRDVAARIYADLADAIVGGVRGGVVDLYSGVGGIALTLAARGLTDVLGIEVNAAAVRDATRAAERASSPARFIASDAAEGLRAQHAIDTLIVNPPRRGLDEPTRAAVLRARPRQLAYISCDPESLARDLATLPGYTLRSVTAYDMHPQTPHVETLALLGDTLYPPNAA